MKKLLLFLFLGLFSGPLAAQAPFGGPGMPPPDLEELDALVKELTRAAFIDTKGREPESEAELLAFEEDLKQLGEQVMDEVVESGREAGKSQDEALSEFFSQMFDQALDEMPPADEMDEETPIEQPKKPTIGAKEAASLQELLENIIQFITSFREKASVHKKTRDALIPYKYRLDDLIFYVDALTDEDLIPYLSQEEFKILRSNLEKLHGDLAQLLPQFTVQEFEVSESQPYEVLGLNPLASEAEIIQTFQQKAAILDPRKRQKELRNQDLSSSEFEEKMKQAKEEYVALQEAYTSLRSKTESEYAFDKILDSIDLATDTNRVIDDIKALLQKHEPELLKQRKLAEAREQKARKKQQLALSKAPPRIYVRETVLRWPEAPKYGSYNGASRSSDFDSGLNDSDLNSKSDRARPRTGSKSDSGTTPSDKKKPETKSKDKSKEDKDKDQNKKKGDKGKDKTRDKKEQPKKDLGKEFNDAKEKIKNLVKKLKEILSKNSDVLYELFREPEYYKKEVPYLIGINDDTGNVITMMNLAKKDDFEKAKTKAQKMIGALNELVNAYRDLKSTITKFPKKEHVEELKKETKKMYEEFSQSEEYKLLRHFKQLYKQIDFSAKKPTIKFENDPRPRTIPQEKQLLFFGYDFSQKDKDNLEIGDLSTANSWDRYKVLDSLNPEDPDDKKRENFFKLLKDKSDVFEGLLKFKFTKED